MPFNTRNPIPSGDLRDLDDNARNIDTWANDKTKLSHPDRFGVERRTWHGIEKEAKLNIQQAIDAKNAAQEAAMMSGFSKYADTLAQLEAGIGTDYVEGDVVMVFQDESRGDTSSIFKIESGAAEFKLTFDKTRQDLLSFTGTISADAEWSDVPAHSDPAFDVQAQALANRTTFLESKVRKTRTFYEFGARGDGANDTYAVNAALASGETIQFLAGDVFVVDYIDTSANVKLRGKGVFQYSGVGVPADKGPAAVMFRGSVDAEYLVITCPGLGTEADDLLRCTGDGVRIEHLELSCDVQRAKTGGSNFFGSNQYIGDVRSKNIARPIAFQPLTVGIRRSNIRVDDIDTDNVIRAVAFTSVDDWSIGRIKSVGRWAGASTNQPGHNTILIQDCNDFVIDLIHSSMALEHVVRFGGSGDCANWEIGRIIAEDCAGCALKFNTASNGKYSKDGRVGSVFGVRVGQGSGDGNREVVRASRVKNVTIGDIVSVGGCTRALSLADVDGLTVGNIVADDVGSRVVECRDDYDGSFESINDVSIGYIRADMRSTSRGAIGLQYEGVGRTIGNISIGEAVITGYSHALITSSTSTVIAAPITVNSQISETGVVIENAPASGVITGLITRGARRYFGDLRRSNTSAGNVFSAVPFQRVSFSDFGEKGTLFLESTGSSAQGAYGASLAFSRVGGGRRGAAVVAKQTGAEARQMGVAILAGANTTGTDEVFEIAIFDHLGVLNLPRTPAYADNAAALAGGLSVGSIYKTPTGEIRMVV